MPAIRSGAMELEVTGDAASVILTSRATGARWVLDSDTCLADGSGRDLVPFGPTCAHHGDNYVREGAPAAVPFETGGVQAQGDRALLVTRRGPAGKLVLRYELTRGACRVTALAGRSSVTACTLPGGFRPGDTDTLPVAIPKNQGVWHRGTGGPFCFHLPREGHSGWTMPFFAPVGTSEALLTIIEDEHDARIWFEKTQSGRLRVAPIMDPSLSQLRYDRSVLLQFVEPDLTAICRAYRQHVQDAGNFVSWEEKIEARPNIEKLFGALMCFIGYCQDEDLDYAASLRALKGMGFDRAFVYPVSMGNLVEDFPMGGRPPIDIRQLLGLLDELGYLGASWMWVEDIPESPDNLLITSEGQPVEGWRIDQHKWYHACPVRQVAIANKIQDERMAGHTAQHFDVTANVPGDECCHPDHPLDRRENVAWRLKVLETAARRGCVVSSEGFWGYAAGSYDAGSVKLPIPVHEDYYTVPMTSLVYHDSCIHDWWEVDNYNNPHHRSQFNRDKYYFARGGGWLHLQAAQDALAGWPPNVMPFGSQYAFVEGRMPDTELYRYSLADPEVKKALKLALPVAKLHGRIGRLPCVKHETLAPDGSVQATVFADGARVVANYADEPREVKGAGLIDPVSWKVAD